MEVRLTTLKSGAAWLMVVHLRELYETNFETAKKTTKKPLEESAGATRCFAETMLAAMTSNS